MQPIASLTPRIAKNLRGVLCDIDDTLTDAGKLVPEAFVALGELMRDGLLVIPVTGRPAGWCDAIARQWPVSGVVGENGAFAFYERTGRLHRLLHPSVAGETARARLREVEAAVLREVPGSRVALDQPYRAFDLAIDFREEPPDLGFEAAEKIRDVFVRFGAHAKVSSIHVNGWFGDYDKLAMSALFLREVFGIDVKEERERFVFVGDSPNDEPMFAFFPHACGVANVAVFVAKMKHPPRYVAVEHGGLGFAEIARRILELRRA